MVRSWTARVEAAYEAELVRTADEVLVLEVGGRVRVGAPDSLDAEVQRAAGRTGAAPLDARWWRTLLGPRVARVVGPSADLFATRLPELPPALHAEQVAPWRLTRLREAVRPEEWEGAGFAAGPSVAFGRFSEPLDPPAWTARATPAARRTVVSAAANLGDWAGAPTDLGVLTHPSYRRRGHATEVAGVATGQAVREAGLARWRADELDPGALAIARRLGFEPWGRALQVRLRD